MAKRMHNTCPECQGPKRGRGYAHKPGCIKATGPYQKKTNSYEKPGRRLLNPLSTDDLIEHYHLVVEMINERIEAEEKRMKERQNFFSKFQKIEAIK